MPDKQPLKPGLTWVNKLMTYATTLSLFRHSPAVPDALSTQKVVTEAFDPNRYYQSYNTGIQQQGAPLQDLKLFSPAVALIAQYYAEKYQTQISYIGESEDNLLSALQSLKNNKQDNFRHAFVIKKDTHDIPVIYLCEKGETALLFADSLGAKRSDVMNLAIQSKMKVYAVMEQRQASDFGCTVDAVMFARDATAINAKTGEYRIPNLLSKLKSRATLENDSLYQAKLPDELLKTAQITRFVRFHQDDPRTIVHKNESLDAFRDRYTDRQVRLPKSAALAKQVDISSYLRMKSFKVADVIELQFYINQLHQQLGSQWSQSLRDQFVLDAKEARKKGEKTLYQMAVNFLRQVDEKKEGELREIILGK
jgi:hypothetical protein